MKIGLFGGTFDPIHIGHLILAETVCSDFPLDRILFIPTAVTPLKDASDISLPDQRLDLIRLAIEGYARFDVSDVEIHRGGTSYTIDTIRWFRESKIWGNASLFLLVGSDSLYDIEDWKHPEEIVSSIQILVVERPGFSQENIPKRYLEQIQWVSAPRIEISSTEIRKRIREGKSIKYWVPQKVEAYIHEKGMYR